MDLDGEVFSGDAHLRVVIEVTSRDVVFDKGDESPGLTGNVLLHSCLDEAREL